MLIVRTVMAGRSSPPRRLIQAEKLEVACSHSRFIFIIIIIAPTLVVITAAISPNSLYSS
jgi:hypothetical protein